MRSALTTYFSLALIVGLFTSAGYAQLDGLYEFDGGGDGTSWDDPANWEQITDPFGNPISGDPATPPSPMTSADIPILGVVLIDNTQAGQTALDVSIGTANGPGSVFVTGGDLTARDVTVGDDDGGLNIGLLSVSGGTIVAGDDIVLGSGSTGIMSMSAGSVSTSDDFIINTNSSLSVTGGSISIGDRLVLENNAGLILDGGDILADDDFFFFGNSLITVNDGTLIVNDKLRFDDDDSMNGRLTINGGLARSNEFGLQVDGLLTDFRGVVEINGDGAYQVEKNDGTGSDPITQLSVRTARDLIAEGEHLVTSESSPLKLGAFEIIVPSFDGRPDVPFVEIRVVPEPGSFVLLSAGALGLLLMKRKK